MPAAYAHYAFGNRVLPLLPEHLKVMIEGDERCHALYNLGVQGPDFFYFYRLWLPFNPVISIGIQMHHAPAEPFFLSAREELKKDMDPALYSYICGLITHFALDSSCHPYILERMKRSGATHHEIESEFDRMLMVQDAKNPFTLNPTDYCDSSIEAAKTAARLFPQVTPQQIREAIRAMKLARGILRSNWLPKRVVLYNLTRLFQVKGMMLTESVRPNCLMSNQELYAIMEKCEPVAARLIKNFDETLYSGAPLSKRFKRNYETRQRYK